MGVGLEAVLTSMGVVLRGQFVSKAGPVEFKTHDGTIVTTWDKQSEAVGRQYMLAHFPDIPFFGEEGGESVGADERYVILFDPLDGTSLFALRGTGSTVIWSLYDRIEKKIKGTIIGEPALGRLWSASEGNGCVLRQYDARGDCTLSETCKVWAEPLSRKSTVLLDVSHGFRRKNADGSTCEIFSDNTLRSLMCDVTKLSKLLMLGSNGLHHALVANGGHGAAGAITTAMGGPFDACGVQLVLEAGGYAAAFKAWQDGLYEVDPLDPLNYDVVVSATTMENLKQLVGCLPLPVVGVVV